MCINNKSIITATSILLILSKIVIAQDLSWECISKEMVNVNSVLVSYNNPRVIYLGTEKGIFKTTDAGDSWQLSLLVKGTNSRVNFMLIDEQGIVYAATGNGLFLSQNQGKRWRRVFKGRDAQENDCRSLVALPNGQFYLATRAGLFISRDKAKTWHRASGRLGARCILSIACDRENKIIYVAALDGVYKIIYSEPDSCRKVFVIKPFEDEDQPEEDEAGQSLLDCAIQYIGIDYRKPTDIYLATDIGVYKSKDYGESWDLMSGFGLLDKKIKFLLVSETSSVYVASKSGIFTYKGGRWEEASLRLPSADIRFLDIDNQHNLYVATDKGLFKSALQGSESMNNASKKLGYFEKEPPIQQVHQAAIKYAQVVDPERIESHRRRARLKALLPEFNLDYDKTISTYNNSNTSRFTVGPCDWAISLKWDFSDLIWSEQQRLIDSQVRLMVQLCNDILDEVTKLYFERRRLKMEVSSGIFPSKMKMEKELKIEELTACLDALTGGYFSQSLENLTAAHQ